MVHDDPSWYALETMVHRVTWFDIDNSWRLARPALRTHGYRSERHHRFAGDATPRSLEVETVIAWGSAALDTLLGTSEGPFSAFISYERLGIMLRDTPQRQSCGQQTNEPLSLQEGLKTEVLYLQFTTYGRSLYRPE